MALFGLTLATLAVAAVVATRRRGRRAAVGVRQKALAVLSEVVPSSWPDARFRRLAPGYDPSVAPWNEPGGPTTCGFLPAWLGYRLGVKITGGGTYELRNVAQAAGAWVEPGKGRLPKPGDLYAIGHGDDSIDHVGAVEKATSKEWITLDAGQGPRDRQAAARVVRPYDAKALSLGGKRVVGWLDLERYFSAKGGKS